jgi:hypothetical protein
MRIDRQAPAMTADEKPPPLPASEARRLAKLAQVPETSFERYYELLTWQLEEAYLANLYLGGAAASERIRASDVDDYLSRLETAIRGLDAILAAASLGQDASAAVAGSLLEETFATGGAAAFGRRLAAYRDSLTVLLTAAGEASKLAADRFPPRRTRGAPRDSNLPFNNFVNRLYETAEMTGGHFPRWYFKTLVQAVDLLRPYLPKSGFFPKGDLGLWLERRAKQRNCDPAKIN